jgi:hypothetical protein
MNGRIGCSVVIPRLLRSSGLAPLTMLRRFCWS